jgi:predicted nuclease with TOPRIM domain
MKEGFDKIDKRFDRCNSEMGMLNSQSIEHNTKLEIIGDRVTNIEKDVKALTERQTITNGKINHLEKKEERGYKEKREGIGYKWMIVTTVISVTLAYIIQHI